MKRSLCALIGLTVLLSGVAFAQEQTGELRGVVREAQGEVLPGVGVRATSPSLIGEATAVTDATGRYRLLRLPPGIYTLSFSLSGFSTVTHQEVQIILGRTLALDIVMTPAALQAETVVIGKAPVVDVTKSASTFEITKEMFDKLPRGRTFESIIAIAAGVNEETAQLNGISFDGSSSSENMFFFDGMDTSDVRAGFPGQTMVFEDMEEVQVKSSGYEAQYGGSMGGVINVITRSGGNAFRGEGVFYMSSSALTGNVRPELEMRYNEPSDSYEAYYATYPKDRQGVYEVGFNLGGYIIKDKLWFYASYLPRFGVTNRDVSFADEPVTGTFKEKRRNDRAAIKLTWQPFAKLRTNLSFNNDYSNWRGTLPDKNGRSDPGYDYGIDGENLPTWTASFNADWTVSNNFLVNVRAGRYYSNDVNITRPPTYPRYYFIYSNADIPGVPADQVHDADWHSLPYVWWNQKNVESRWSSALDLTYYFDVGGEHVAKAGFNWTRAHRQNYSGLAQDYYYFCWGQDYWSPNLGDVPTEFGYFYVVDPGADMYSVNSDRYNLYLQDSWTIGKRLTLNLGVRMESEVYPSFLDRNSDLAKEHPEYLQDFINFGFGDKIAPRLGFAYDILGDSRFKLFGSYGVYYDVMKLHMSAAPGGALWEEHYYTIPASLIANFELPEYQHLADNPPADLAPYYLESFNQYIPSFDMVDKNIKPYSKMEYTLGFQTKLSEDISASVRYLHNQIRWAIEDIGVIVPDGSSYYIANPGSDYINQKYAESSVIPGGVTCPKAVRKYDSFDIGVDKRFSHAWMAGFHYTLSRLWGNMSDLASSDEDGRQDPNTSRYFDGWWLAYTQNYPNQNLGILPTDRPHQFKFYGAYTFNFGLTVGSSLFAFSGTPESTELSINDMDGFYPLGRGDMGRNPFLWRMDLYAEQTVKLAGKYALHFMLNVQNLTNNRIAYRTFNTYNQEGFWLTNDQLIQGFDYSQIVQDQNILLDPRFGKQFYFQPPIAVNLGVKFSF